jgi:hypothetical protein
MESLQIENLITLADAGFVAAVIGLIEVLKTIFPKIESSKTLKRVITVVITLVGAFLITIGNDLTVLENLTKSLTLLVETVGSYALIVKPISEQLKKKQ